MNGSKVLKGYTRGYTKTIKRKAPANNLCKRLILLAPRGKRFICVPWKRFR